MLRRKRGPYKSYLSPGAKVEIPKTTEEKKKKRQKLFGNQTLLVSDAPNKSSSSSSVRIVADDVETAGPSSNNDSCSLVTPNRDDLDQSFSLLSSSESELELSSLNENRLDSRSEGDSSDFNISSDRDIENIDSDSNGKHTPSETYVEDKNVLSEALIGSINCNMSKHDIMLMVLIYSIRHNLTYVAVTDLLKLVNVILGTNLVPDSKYWFSKVFNSKIEISYHMYCPLCMTYLGIVPPESRSTHCVDCPSCENQQVTYSIDNNKPTVFITISMTNQLQMLLETRKDLQPHLQYRFQRNIECNLVGDIFDGLSYKKLTENGGFLSDRHNFSITFNTDGAPVYKSSKCSIWPLQFFVNELPPDVRFKPENIMMGGLWFGSKDPRMDVFMIPLVKEMRALETSGINWKCSSGQSINSKFITLCCCLDSVARPMVQGIKQFNGYFGCAYCLHPGHKIERHHIRFTEEKHSNIMDRSNKMIRKDMRDAVKSGEVVHGVKTKSPLYFLPTFDLVHGFVIDYMHCILLGVTRTLTNMWLDSSNHDQPYYIGLLIENVDKKLLSITPPSTLTRMPRSLSSRAHWKANEWRNWLLFYSLPCLNSILPKKFFDHLSILVFSVFTLLKEKISHGEIDLTNQLLNKFVKEYEVNYGKMSMTYNVHLLKHVPKNVSLWGPLWAYSAFVFENGNGVLLNLVKGTTGVATQIVNKYVRCSSIPQFTSEIVVEECVQRFCTQLMSVPALISAAHIMEGIVFLGRLISVELSQEEIAAFQQSNLAATSLFYKRLLYKGKKYCCTNYKKQKKSSDSAAILKSGEYITIHRFVVIEKESYILCSVINTRQMRHVSREITSINIHLRNCVQDNHDQVVAIRKVEDIETIALLLNVGEEQFVSTFPNLWERD